MTSSTVPADLDRARFVAATYGKQLRGLGAISDALTLVGLGVGLTLFDRSPTRVAAGVAVVLVACGASWRLATRVRAYYQRTFGQAYASVSTGNRLLLVQLGVTFAVVSTVAAAAPAKLLGAFFALTLALPWVRWPGPAAHHLLAAVAYAALVFAPLDRVFGVHPLGNTPGLFVALAVVVLVTGLIDHRILVSVLGGEPVAETA